ncbi:MAG: peptidase M28, partial [Acidobacteria bacterium]|nr:peptidase M28 [Acidobacteriota bacterium]
MKRRTFTLIPLACALLVSIGVLGPLSNRIGAQSGEPVDLDAIYRIKDEGLNRSQVMDTVWWLTEVYGPRLTNSPQMRAAADWAVRTLTEWGLANVKQEPWGVDFGRGWSNERTVVHVITPSPWPVLAYAKAWTPGTGAAVTAEAILAPMAAEADFDKFRGKLQGKVALLQNPREVQPLFQAPARRYTLEQLEEMETQPVSPPRGPQVSPGAGQAFAQKRNAFLVAEGVAAVLEPGNGRGDSGSVLVG